MPKKSNERKNARHKCYVPVDSKEGSAFESILTLDISRAGMGLLSSREIPVDEKIAVELDLDSEREPVLVMGKVVWVEKLPDLEKFRLGMKFTDGLSDNATSRLKQQYPK